MTAKGLATVSDLKERFAAALAERDAILLALDAEGAKAFIVKHGGRVPARIDWTTVLHLARWEWTECPEAERIESQVYLARNGPYGIGELPQNSPYARAALDLIFPSDTWQEMVGQIEGPKE